MAIPADTVFEVRSTATAGNLNGGGFSDANKGATGVDYSQQNAAQVTWTSGGGNNDLACVTGTATLTSTSGGFLNTHPGNLIHITAGTNFTADWYCVVGFTDANKSTLDRDPTTGSNASAGTGYLGGACSSLNGVGSDALLPAVAGNTIYIDDSGTYTAGVARTYAAQDGTPALPITVIGYDATFGRSVTPSGTDRPQLIQGAYALTAGYFWIIRNMRWTGTVSGVVTAGSSDIFVNCQGINTSTSGNRLALNALSTGRVQYSEFASLVGYGAVAATFEFCVFWDSARGLSGTSAITVIGCVFDSCARGISTTSGVVHTHNCVFRNCGTAILTTTTAGASIITRTIFADNYLGLSYATSTPITWLDYNLWNNNGTDIAAGSGMAKGPHDVTGTDPGFGSSLASGTTATTNGAGTEFTATGLLAGVTTNDVLVIHAGTGETASVYDITSIAGLPNSITLGRSAGASASGITWGIVKGTDFRVSNNARYSLAYPGYDDSVSAECYGAVGIEPTLPAAGDVDDTAAAFGYTGALVTPTLALPAVGDVEESAQYGAAGTEFTGTFAVPTEAQVELGVGFGEDGTEFTGTLVVGGGSVFAVAEPVFVPSRFRAVGYR